MTPAQRVGERGWDPGESGVFEAGTSRGSALKRARNSSGSPHALSTNPHSDPLGTRVESRADLALIRPSHPHHTLYFNAIERL